MSAEWLVPEQALLPEQQRAVTLSPYKPRIIFGPPGAGKTIILAYRAKYLQEAYRIQGPRLLILAFTNALKGFIQAALEDLNLDPSRVQTFDKWCRTFHEQTIGPPPSINGRADPENTRLAVQTYLLQHPHQDRLLDAVLVDEGHDLDPASFEILKRLSEHVTVMIDHKQQLYSTGCSQRKLLSTFGLRRINMALLEGFRCSFSIAALAARFIQDSEKAEEFLRQTQNRLPEREKPFLFIARDFAEEMEHLVMVLKTRQSLGERIGILVPERWQAEKLPQLCAEHGVTVEGPPLRPQGRTPDYPVYDFGSDSPKAMTYHSAKGLTFDTVLMPRLTNRHFPGALAEKMNELLFVGVTRATHWLYMSTTHSDMIPPIRSLHHHIQVDPTHFELTLKHGRYERQGNLFAYNSKNDSRIRGMTLESEIDNQTPTKSTVYADMF